VAGRRGRAGLLAGVIAAAWPLVAAAGPVEAPVRQQRPLLVGLSIGWPWISGHDATVPVPGFRAGLAGARLSVELGAAFVPFGGDGGVTVVDLGARWFVRQGAAAPYLMVRAGDYFDNADEGGDRSYPFAVAGAGLDYSCRCGLSAWFEIGPSLVSYTASDVGPRSIAGGVYTSLGVGYRLHR